MSGEATPKVYSDADVDRIVAKRLAEREQGAVVAELKKELDSFRKELAADRKAFARQQAEQQALLRAHIAQSMHAGTAEKFEELEAKMHVAAQEFGVDDMTPDERAAIPLVVRTVMAGQRRANDLKQAEKESAEADTRFWQRVAALTGAAFAVSSLLSATGFFRWVQITVFHLHG